jgi:hypothetical protein
LVSTNYTTLADWQAALSGLTHVTGKDANSVSTNPNYASDTDLTPNAAFLDGAATALTAVTTDIDGVTRGTPPDIGAKEFEATGANVALLSISRPPVPFTAGTYPVEVEIENRGGDPLTSATINWTVNGVAQTAYSWTGSLATGASETVQIATFDYQPVTLYELTAIAADPNGTTDIDLSDNATTVLDVHALLALSSYGIGGTGDAFANFTEAVSALNFGGVASTSGGVTFSVASGTYTERISIGEFPNSSCSIPIVFESASGDSTDVVLEYSGQAALDDGLGTSTFDYVVQVNGADGITFRNMTLRVPNVPGNGDVVEVLNDADCLTLEGNVIEYLGTSGNYAIHSVPPSSVAGNNDDHVYRNNVVSSTNGIAIYKYGFGTSTEADQETGLLIEGNEVSSGTSFGIHFLYQSGAVIRDNVVNSRNYAIYPFLAYGGSGGTVISGNTLTVNQENAIGLYVQSIYGAFEISGNRVLVENGSQGISANSINSTTSTERGLIANNFVTVLEDDNSGTNYGIFIGGSQEYVDVYYNSVLMRGSGVTSISYALYNTISGSSSEVNIVDNILANEFTNGVALYVPSTSTSYPFNSDHNDLYAPNGSVGRLVSTNYTTLADWQAALSGLTHVTGKDANSVSIDPVFVSSTDLHVEAIGLNGAATPLTAVTTDIDGETRDPVEPDIGADEFVASGGDAGLLAISAPSVPFTAGSNDVAVELLNNSAEDLTSVTINWAVDGTAQTPYEWTGTLASGTSVEVIIGSFNFVFGNAYDITASTSSPNGLEDSNPANDAAELLNIYPAPDQPAYTIGGTSPDFTTIGDAVTAISNSGVTASVAFNIRDGVYNEQLVIPAIPNAAAERTVTFQSESGDSTAVEINFASNQSSPENYVVLLNNASFVNFRQLTLRGIENGRGRVLVFEGGAEGNVFDGLVLNNQQIGGGGGSQNALVYFFNIPFTNVSFTNSLFLNGSYGLFLNVSNTALASSNVVIDNNIFTDQSLGAIWLQAMDGPVIANNQIDDIETLTSSSYAGIEMNQGNTSFAITSNKINVFTGDYGIIFRNGNDSPASDPGLIANNFIYMGEDNFGRGLQFGSDDYVNVYYNSIHTTGTTTTSSVTPLFINGGSNLNFRNNIFANSGGGYAAYFNSTTAVASSVHNNYYTTGSNLAFWQGNRATLASLRTISGDEANSLAVDPVFQSDTELYIGQVQLQGAAQPIAGITTDIDGEPRDENNPDIGADEFSTAGSGVNLLGTISLQGRPAPPNNQWITPLTVELYSEGATEPFITYDVTTDASGGFSITDAVAFAGNYVIRVKNFHSLANAVSVTLAEGTNTINLGELQEGDANDDNAVEVQDFSILSAAFFTVSGDPDFDGRTDFNEDDAVSIVDFSLLSGNFFETGDVVTSTSFTDLQNLNARTTNSWSAMSTGEVYLKTIQPTENMTLGSTFDLPVYVIAGKQEIDGAEVHLDFDTNVLRVREVIGSDKLPMELLNGYDNDKGMIDFAAGAFSNLPKGDIALFTVKFEVVGYSEESLVSFLYDEEWSSSEVAYAGKSLLGGVFDSVIKQLQCEDCAYNITDVNAYPNPNAGVFKLDIPEAYQRDIIVTGADGRRVHTIKKDSYSGQQIEIDLSAQPSGVYLIHLGDDKERKTLRIQKIE